jgi:hypothetical protein
MAFFDWKKDLKKKKYIEPGKLNVLTFSERFSMSNI